MGQVLRLTPPVIARITQPNGKVIEVRAGERISVDDRGWTRVHPPARGSRAQ